MLTEQILVDDLSKTYRVPEREAGLAASIKSLLRRSYRSVEAVRNISFSIEPGEVVGFIRPNGAGKTTTLKMLSGLLMPTSGIPDSCSPGSSMDCSRWPAIPLAFTRDGCALY
jgi:ABC-2 type transport system ATP-binding protein